MPSSPILNAFANNTPLPKIIADFNLSTEDLHTFLTSPGIPERLSALRTLARFDRDLRETTAQADAVTYLHTLIKKPDTTELEGRRAATALLRGCHGSSGPNGSNASRASAHSAKRDISDWADPDDFLDDEDDDTDDSPAQSPAPAHSQLTVSPTPPSSSPNAAVAHALAAIRAANPTDPTTAFRAIYESLDLPAKVHGRWNEPFKADLVRANLVDLRGSEITPEPAITHTPDPANPANPTDPANPTSPPSATATVRITIKKSGGPATPVQIRLTSSGPRYPTDPFPLHWHINAITPDTT